MVWVALWMTMFIHFQKPIKEVVPSTSMVSRSLAHGMMQIGHIVGDHAVEHQNGALLRKGRAWAGHGFGQKRHTQKHRAHICLQVIRPKHYRDAPEPPTESAFGRLILPSKTPF